MNKVYKHDRYRELIFMKRLVQSFAFIMIILVALTFTGYILRPKETDICVKQIRDFHSLGNNSLDAIVYGSSHSWLGFDAKEFSEKTGMNTYNYSCYWQSFNTTWLFFNDSLKSQKPKVAFIEVGRVNDYLHDVELEGQIYYTRKLRLSGEKLQYVYQCFGSNLEQYFSYALPIVSFHTKWENLEDVFKPGEDVDFTEVKGQMVSNGTFEVEPELIGYEVGKDDDITQKIQMINEYEGGEIGQQPIREENLALMKDIAKKCNEKGIRLIWFAEPYVGDYNYDQAMEQFVKENGGEYVNLFNHLSDMNFDSKTDLADADHLNSSGAKKVSDYLSTYINK